MNAVEVRGLTKKYKDFALRDISFELPSGCVMGIIGENGSGKSTILRSVLGMVNADGGEIRIFGEKAGDFQKNDIGIVMDEIGVPQFFDARETETVMKNSFSNWNSEIFHSYLEKFRLPEKKDIKKFSKGMKMKMSIAIALSHDAKLLVMDEPTSGLDPLIRDEIIDIFTEFTREEDHSILLSSHIVSDLEKLCDYIAFVHNGELILCQEKDRLLEQYGIMNTTEEILADIEPTAVIGKKSTGWGVEAMVDRAMIPHTFDIKPISIEEIFVFMVKGAKRR